ncbi:MAG: hypothetical protein V3S37_04375 [Dehalococcoidia bacterium]
MDVPKQDQDSSQKGDTSGDAKGTSTLTEEQAQARETKAVSDALAKAGRTTADQDAREQRITDKETKAADDRSRERQERNEAALEAARDDPEKLTALQRSQKAALKDEEIADGRRKLDGDQAKHDESVKGDLETIRIFNRTKLASEVAVTKGVSMDSILKHAKDDTREAMEAVAEDLPKNKEPLKVDSSRSSGTGEQTEEQRLKARYPTM